MEVTTALILLKCFRHKYCIVQQLQYFSFLWAHVMNSTQLERLLTCFSVGYNIDPFLAWLFVLCKSAWSLVKSFVSSSSRSLLTGWMDGPGSGSVGRWLATLQQPPVEKQRLGFPVLQWRTWRQHLPSLPSHQTDCVTLSALCDNYELLPDPAPRVGFVVSA